MWSQILDIDIWSLINGYRHIGAKSQSDDRVDILILVFSTCKTFAMEDSWLIDALLVTSSIANGTLVDI